MGSRLRAVLTRLFVVVLPAQGAFTLDLQLPGYGGQALLQDFQIRAEARGAELPLCEIAGFFCHNLSSFLSDSGHSL